MRVVIVDDEVKLTNVLKEFLTLRGFQVWAAIKGKEAVQLIQTHQPDALLLDLTLEGSGLQGIDVLKKTKEVSPATRIIVISGNTDEAKKAEVLQLGAMAYLDKPLSMQDVLKAIQDATTSSASS